MPPLEDPSDDDRELSREERLLEMLYLAADVDHLSRLAMRLQYPEIAQALAQTASDILALVRTSRKENH